MSSRDIYRSCMAPTGLVGYKVQEEESDLMIYSSCEHQALATKLLQSCRRTLKGYIAEHPHFLTSLVPLNCADDAPLIVKEMTEASAKVGVGPMAAVAGAVAAYLGRNLLEYSAEVIVENGGDIFMCSQNTRRVAVYAGDSSFSQRIAVEIKPADTPIGICTSAGKIGHSLSFGNCHAALVVAHNTALADAAATALGNAIRTKADITAGLNIIRAVPGVEGALAIIDDQLGAWGKIQLVKA